MLQEYYEDVAWRAMELRDTDDRTHEQQDALDALEDVLAEPEESKRFIANMTLEEREEDWYRPRLTGDPLTDRWEMQIARGEVPDLNETE